MNSRQLVALWTGVIGGVFTLLFPVCETTSKMPGQTHFATVHRYLYTWPMPELDIPRTLFQLMMVALLTGAAVASLRTGPPNATGGSAPSGEP